MNQLSDAPLSRPGPLQYVKRSVKGREDEEDGGKRGDTNATLKQSVSPSCVRTSNMLLLEEHLPAALTCRKSRVFRYSSLSIFWLFEGNGVQCHA